MLARTSPRMSALCSRSSARSARVAVEVERDELLERARDSKPPPPPPRWPAQLLLVDRPVAIGVGLQTARPTARGGPGYSLVCYRAASS